MIVEVEMWAFAQGKIRQVEVPDEEMALSKDVHARLEQVWYYGQNDIQPQQIPSVSMGDIVRLDGKRWIAVMIGFEEIPEGIVACIICDERMPEAEFPAHRHARA
jgi:hypothetical protein